MSVEAGEAMKQIRNALIEICYFLDILVVKQLAVDTNVYDEFKRNQCFHGYIAQSANIATIKCSNNNICVDVNVLKRSQYFRNCFYFDLRNIESSLIQSNNLSRIT